MNPANIPGTHHRFTWETSGQGNHYTCDMPEGTLHLRRVCPQASSFNVRWNERHVGLGLNLDEARALAEQMYMEGRL